MSLKTGDFGSWADEADCEEWALNPEFPMSPPPLPHLQVYSATNVELVTRTRTEHLSDQDKLRNKGKPRCDCLLPSHPGVWCQGSATPGRVGGS